MVRYKDAPTIHVWNLDIWKKTYGDYAVYSKDELFKRTMVVHGDNRETLAEMFGPRQQTFLGSEYRFDVWRVPFGSSHFWVLSAKGKGTNIEMERPGDEADVVPFMEDLYTKLMATKRWSAYDWSFMDKK